MQLIDIVTLLTPQEVTSEQRLHPFPRMYALSKTGSIRVYDVTVEDFGDHAVMTTRKKVTLNGKWTEDKYEYWSGVNIGKSNETTYLEQALSEAQSLWKRLQDAGFTTEMPNPDAKFNTDANGKIKPMLAISFDEKKIRFPCLCQPKYDGVRCTISEDSEGIHIISRKGKPYKIPHLEEWANEHRDLLPLDGELYNHKELTFQEIVSAVKRISEITPKIRYVVYDKPVKDEEFSKRWNQLLISGIPTMGDIDLHNKRNLDKRPIPTVYLSDFAYCKNMDDVWKCHEKWVSQGYEGAIIRNYDGLYEFGFRSNNLIKLKTFDDAEFEIADVVEATGRDAGTAVFVLYLHGHEGEGITEENTFKAKPQGSRELRKEYFENTDKIIGKLVTVQYQGLSDDGKPRFPSAITIRDYE